MTVYALGDKIPTVSDNAWVAPDANVIGLCDIQDGASIWFGATLRGDNELISIGKNTNIQENSVLHTDMGYPMVIGEGCTIGHKVMLHGCTIGENTLIGMGAVILNGAKIGKNCLIGAGALITENKEIPDGSLVMGSPGKVVRTLDDETIERLRFSATHYSENAQRFKTDLKPLS